MKFTGSNQSWLRGISVVQNAVGSPISNPIVENIHVSCEDNKVTFVATNLNLTLQCVAEAEVEEEGEIVLPSELLRNIVRDLPQGDVYFECDNQLTKMKCGEFVAKLKGYGGELFPQFNRVDEGIKFNVESQRLKEIIHKTIITTSTDKTRFELDGIKFDIQNGIIKFIATDGRRLSFYQLENEQLRDVEMSCFVPTKTLQEVQRSFQDEGESEITIQEKKIQFYCGDTTVVSNLLVENFPQYERIIPPPGDIKVVLNREELSGAVKRSSNLSSQETNLVILNVKNNQADIFAEREEIGGEGRETISVKYEGEPLELRYNFHFLLDFLRVEEKDEIEIEINDPKKPGILRGIADENFLYVLMPMRPPDQE